MNPGSASSIDETTEVESTSEKRSSGQPERIVPQNELDKTMATETMVASQDQELGTNITYRVF